MQTALYYLLGLGAFALVAGGVIAFFALRNAPEGFEDENGFVGMTKGDEFLLEQYSHPKQAYPAVHGPLDLVA
jgi:hypothetical protein